MKIAREIEIDACSNEEQIPELSADFPYLASCAELERYSSLGAPWHWHRALELFYVKSGALEYTTPNGRWVFSAGSGGLINCNVMHTSRVIPSGEETVQLLHLFAPEFLGGGQMNRMDVKYIRPITSAWGTDLIPLYADNRQHAEILKQICLAFELDEMRWGYEFALRAQLSQIWLALFDVARPLVAMQDKSADETIKAMLRWIHVHHAEAVSIEQMAREAHVSKRTCYRLFSEKLNTTPVAYITTYRLQRACRMLAETDESMTEISQRCGLGSSSYFSKCFRERFGCTPTQYRMDWRNCDKDGHK